MLRFGFSPLTSIRKLPYTAQCAEVSSVHSNLLAAIGFQSCPKVFSKLSPSYLKMFQVVLKLSQFVSKLSHICLKVVAKFFAIIPNFQNVKLLNIRLSIHDIGLNHLTPTPFGHFSFSSILFLYSMTSASG